MKLNNSTEFISYFLISSLCLLIDVTVYLYLYNNVYLAQEVAASIGYLAGLFFAYILLKKIIFNEGWFKERRFIESTLFFVSGMIGILCTYLTVIIYQNIYENESHIAKIVAICISFILVYLFRKLVVFKKIK